MAMGLHVPPWWVTGCPVCTRVVYAHSFLHYLFLQQTGIKWQACAVPWGHRDNTGELIFQQGEYIG